MNRIASDTPTLGFLVATVSRLMRRQFGQRLDSSRHLTLAQARALGYIARHPGVRQVQLAEVLEVQPISLARLIDQLEAAGLVQRRSDPSDRRAYQLFVRPAAQKQLTQMAPVMDEVYQVALQGLTPQEVNTLERLLMRVQDNLSSR